MLFPFRTDAPIYHWPIVTVGLIVVNTLIFVMGLQNVEPLLLQFGHGLYPTQWLTNIFLHADILHLLGNMVWLWAFGLIVEGKLGWWKYLLVYLGIGIAQSAVCLLYTSPSPRDRQRSRMPSSA